MMLQNMISNEDVCINTGLGLGLGSQGMAEDEPRSGNMRKKTCFSWTGLEPSLSLGLRAMEESIDVQCQGSPQSDISSFSTNTRVKREMELGSEERLCRMVVFDEEEDVNVRKKLRLSKEQSALLEDSFKENITLNPKQKLALAKQLNLRPRQVEVWFQNRRARTKLKQTEVDCEYLKKCFEVLTKENKRLQKELSELKALNVAPQLYMHVPAATLKICPSCERINGAGFDNTSTKVSYTTTKKAHLHNPCNWSSATC